MVVEYFLLRWSKDTKHCTPEKRHISMKEVGKKHILHILMKEVGKNFWSTSPPPKTCFATFALFSPGREVLISLYKRRTQRWIRPRGISGGRGWTVCQPDTRAGQDQARLGGGQDRWGQRHPHHRGRAHQVDQGDRPTKCWPSNRGVLEPEQPWWGAWDQLGQVQSDPVWLPHWQPYHRPGGKVI